MFPWGEYYTIATVIFHWNDKKFWKSTPKIITGLWEALTGLVFGKDNKKNNNIVYRGGKPYRKIEDAAWS